MWVNKLCQETICGPGNYSLKLKEGDSIHKHIKLMTEIFELSFIGDFIDEED